MTGLSGQVVIEVAAQSVADAVAAEATGADRIELCARLDLQGLTPSPMLQEQVIAAVRIPVFVMVRPRAGGFLYSPVEVARMKTAIEQARAAGAAGVVLGALGPGGRIDALTLRSMVEQAHPMAVTFHRAFDEVADPDRALGACASAGVSRVLTAGGRGSAWEGRDALARWVRMAPDGVRVVAGGRVRANHVRQLVEHTGVGEIHLGFDAADPERIAAVRQALGGR